MPSNQFLRFSVISLFTNGSGLALAVALNLVGLTPVFCSSTSYIYGLLVSYVLHGKYTFRTDIAVLSIRTTKFVGTHVAGFTLNAATIHVLTDLKGASFLYCQLVSTLLCGAAIFTLNKYWVFRDEAGKLNASI